MLAMTRLKWVLWLCAAAAVLLAACQSAPPGAPAVAPTASALSLATPATTPVQAATPPATSTPLPTLVVAATSLPADTATGTTAPTATSPILTTTAAPSDTPVSPTVPPSATARPTARPTRPPITITPLGPPASGSIYSTTSGPAGYATHIKCARAGAPCAALMPPGDVSFSLSLASDAAAPWTHFIYYGLSVEKDGHNVAEAFMFADAGWLQPGTVVGLGASRNFNQPGVYVIRSSGCLTTDTQSKDCGWATLAGDVVTFTIQ
jgi:hypothetical protein